MSSATPPPVINDGERINWAELPPELTSSILHRLDAIEILESAQKVCRPWRRVCKDPSMWRKIVMHKPGNLSYWECRLLEKMCRHAVDRSQGGLTEISIWQFCTDDLLNYIADRSSNLRILKIPVCDTRSRGVMEAVVKLPLLEELDVSYFSISGESLKVVGQSCPNLKTLKINGYYRYLLESDVFALAIAETMPGLCHLQLFRNGLTNVGLNVILDNCPNLEHLDLRHCFHLKLVGDLEKRCSERIKVVRFPNDSISDYPYDAMVSYMDDSSEDDYPLRERDVSFSDDPYDYY